MRTLLVDFRTEGHHLEYASRLLEELQCLDVEVTMLGAEPDERYEELFDRDQIEYLFERGRDFASELARRPDVARRRAFERVRAHVASTNYDVVHFLQIDDAIEACYRRLQEWNAPPIVGSLNGAFFSGREFRKSPLTIVSDWLFHPTVADALPARTNKSTLHRCLRDGVFDHLVVPTAGSKVALERYVPDAVSDPLTVVPDPVEPWYDALPEQERARQDLDLPLGNPMLLYFGEMRAEKGVGLLLDALESYEGTLFTMVLAGSPTDLAEADLIHVENSAVTLCARAEFVPEDAVPRYFAAADGAVLPYRQSFGALRPSGVFQKACASHLPVLGPDFGFFQRRIEEHRLGTTFEAGNAASLTEGLEQHVESISAGIEADRFKEYVRTQSFRQLAEELVVVYQTVQ